MPVRDCKSLKPSRLLTEARVLRFEHVNLSAACESHCPGCAPLHLSRFRPMKS
jgi:hypothetical protein